jgi:predicted transposase/invertase (TIGR01784 family)
MTFTQYPELLQRLVSELLGIQYDNIEHFRITSPELTPDFVGEKFCKLDISMIVNSEQVNLEVQVNDEGDFPERSLYYWARMYSSALGEGKDYSELPRTITINILGFTLFDCKEFHSEFEIREVRRHELLTDKLTKHFYELDKLPPLENMDSIKEFWLKLFNAKTEEDLTKLTALEVPIMSQAVAAYRQVSTSPEFREYERIRQKARHDEAQIVRNAEQRGEERGEKRAEIKWQGVVADKDAVIADKDAEIAEQATLIAELRAKHGDN